ncbi:MAG: hypothetical protein ACO2O6_08060 [Candidatus Hydrothermia bacterium]|jgi:hypothetical protein
MLIEGEKELYRWKSLILTNYRVIKKKGKFWKHYVDINYDHVSSVYTGRTPNWKLIIIGIILIIIEIILHRNYYIDNPLPIIGIIAIIIGIIGIPKTIILGCNGKIEENGKSLEFMKKLNEYRLRYLGRI